MNTNLHPASNLSYRDRVHVRHFTMVQERVAPHTRNVSEMCNSFRIMDGELHLSVGEQLQEMENRMNPSNIRIAKLSAKKAGRLVALLLSIYVLPWVLQWRIGRHASNVQKIPLQAATGTNCGPLAPSGEQSLKQYWGRPFVAN